MTMAVGGLALHWGGACNRFSEEDLRLKSMYGLATDWPVAWDELERYYVEAERALNVAGEPSPYPEDRRSGPYPQPAVPLSYNLQVLKAWAEQSGLKFNALPMARNLTPADGRGSCCVFDTCGDVCPSGARYSPDFTFRQLIERKQIVLHDRTLIRKLTLDEARPVVAAATGVHQDRPGETEEYRARLFVLASGYCWSPHLLLLSANSRFPNGLANRSGLVGRYMTGHPFIEARATIDDQTFPGQHMVHSLISREHFRCATDKPFVRHDTRVWESSSGREPRLRSAEGRLLLGDEVFEDWRSRTKGSSVRLRTYLDMHPSADSRLTLDAAAQEPLRRSDAVDRAPLRRGDHRPPGGVEAARAGPLQPDGAREQRQDREHQRGRLPGSPGGRLPHGHRSRDQRVRQLRPHARSREPLRRRRADAADRRLHQRHADVRRADAAIVRAHRRGAGSRLRQRPLTRACARRQTWSWRNDASDLASLLHQRRGAAIASSVRRVLTASSAR